MALYKRGAIWYYDFRIRGKRYKGCTSQHDKAKARAFEDNKKAEVRFGGPMNGPAPKVLPIFEEWAKLYRDGDGALKRSGGDDQSILDRALVPFFGKMHLDAITRGDVERFRNDRLAGRLSDVAGDRNRKAKPAPATVALELGLLRRIFNVAIESAVLERNPVAKLRMPKVSNRRDRVIDSTEYDRLLAAVDQKQGAHMRPIIILAFETGMRLGEVVGLRWADVDHDRHMVRLSRTKNGEPRNVPLSESAERALADWSRRKDWSRRESTHVFPSTVSDRPTSNVSAAFARLVKRAKVVGVRFHDLRHTFCTRMVERGTDLITLADITGHKTLAMLRRYSHPSDARKLAVVRGPESSPQKWQSEVEHPKERVL